MLFGGPELPRLSPSSVSHPLPHLPVVIFLQSRSAFHSVFTYVCVYINEGEHCQIKTIVFTDCFASHISLNDTSWNSLQDIQRGTNLWVFFFQFY